MEQGYVILIIIALMFLGMYLFSNYSVYLEKLKYKKLKQEELHKEELRHEKLAKKQEARNAKWRKMDDRRKEMKQELARLKEIKREWENRGRPLA